MRRQHPLPVGFGAALVAAIMGYGPHILKDAMDKLGIELRPKRQGENHLS